MIRHIVCFQLKNPTPEVCAEAKKVLLSMEGRVPQLRGLQVGVDFLHSDRSYDLVLEVDVEDREALEAYQNDPYHCGTVKPHMHAVRTGSVTVDYEY